MPVTDWLLFPQGVVSGATLGILVDAPLGCAVQTALPPATPFTTAEISFKFWQRPHRVTWEPPHRPLGGRPAGQLVKGSSRWLKSQVPCVMPEQVLLSRVPGHPPLSRWIAQIDSRFMLLAWAKPCIVCASGR